MYFMDRLDLALNQMEAEAGEAVQRRRASPRRLFSGWLGMPRGLLREASPLSLEACRTEIS